MPKFEVQNTEIEKLLKQIGRAIKKILPKGWGFTLFIFDYGKDGSMFYISTAERFDMLQAIREWINKTSGTKN